MKFFKLRHNFYFVTAILFCVWIFFIDSNDILTQIKLKNKIYDLESKKLYYKNKIVELEKEKEALFSNPKKLEKFAREKYLMKKESENLYLLVE